MNRYEDGKFQPNVEENAFVTRLISLFNVGCIPDYIQNTYMEFTPIDSCAEAIIKLMQYPSKLNRIFHLFNHNHIFIDPFLKVINKYVNFNVVTDNEFINKINYMLKQEDSNKLLSGILRDFNSDRKLVYDSKIKIKSDFTINYLNEIGFLWPNIDEDYLVKFLDYFVKLGYIKKEK